MCDTGYAFTNPTNPNYTKEIGDLALNRFYEKALVMNFVFCFCCDLSIFTE